MSEIVPPRHPSTWQRPDSEPISDNAYREWASAVCMLLPDNAFIDDHHGWAPVCTTATWSNSHGVWQLDLGSHRVAQAVLRRLYSSGSRDDERQWRIDDPHPNHIGSLLQVLGAIEVTA